SELCSEWCVCSAFLERSAGRKSEGLPERSRPVRARAFPADAYGKASPGRQNGVRNGCNTKRGIGICENADRGAAGGIRGTAALRGAAGKLDERGGHRKQ